MIIIQYSQARPYAVWLGLAMIEKYGKMISHHTKVVITSISD